MRILCGTILAAAVASVALGEMQQPCVPELLRCDDGHVADTVATWEMARRPELVETFTREVYGRRPVERPADLRFEVIEPDKRMMDGTAIRKRIRASWSGPYGTGSFSFTAFIPSVSKEGAPAFLFICNRNAKANIDPDRVQKSGFWPAEEIVARGYAAVAFYNGDVAPDFYDGFSSGVYTSFENADVKRMEPWGATWGTRSQESWGAISAWAWGASRIMDWIETEPLINSRRVAVVGHSRGGKTALWAAATDTRFAMACVNGSGECGAKLRHYSGYPQGQTIEDITRRFPHWFAWRFHRWMGRDRELPFDQHEVLALVAPRLLFVSNASQDEQEPEYLALKSASPVWELYGMRGFVSDGYPAFDVVQDDGAVAFRRRDGAHDLTLAEWSAYMDFTDKKGWVKLANGVGE